MSDRGRRWGVGDRIGDWGRCTWGYALSEIRRLKRLWLPRRWNSLRWPKRSSDTTKLQRRRPRSDSKTAAAVAGRGQRKPTPPARQFLQVSALVCLSPEASRGQDASGLSLRNRP